jgi:orotidine-5'-phosphate decarboxylase
MAELIVALDVASASDAERLLERLPEVRWVKVGSVLMTAEGGELVRRFVTRGLRVFLDLKWHDIPNTVAGAVRAAHDLGVAMATVHTLGGRRMMEAAAQAAGTGMSIVGVTVLTSHDAASYASATGRHPSPLEGEVRRLAESAREAGLAGAVCSPLELGTVRQALGAGALIVVPGIRREADAGDDQVRTAAPRDAVAGGATHLVVGRPITAALDPAAAFRGVLAEAGHVAGVSG